MSTAVNKLWKLFSTESYRLPNYKGTDARVSLLVLLIRTYSKLLKESMKGQDGRRTTSSGPPKRTPQLIFSSACCSVILLLPAAESYSTHNKLQLLEDSNMTIA